MGLTRPRAYQIYDIDYKQSVRVITTTNISISGGAPNTVDGVSLATSDRILVTGQSVASNNGIYQVSVVGTGSNGTWIRSTDTNASGELLSGTIVMVTEGTVYADTSWKLITNDPITIGVTPLTWEINTGNAFGTISANGTSIVANSAIGTVTFTSGNNFVINGTSGTDSISFAVSDTPSFLGTVTSVGITNSTAFAVGNSAVSNVALGFFPTAGTPGEYAIRDYSTVTNSIYFDVGMGGTANGSFQFRTTNSYSTLATIDIYGIKLTTNRPAFRVYGSGTTNNLTTTQNSTGALNGNNWAADYTQGSGLNSTTGVFTAPVAGLYQINVVGRNSGYSGGISQLAVVKNATGGTGSGGTVQCMIEWAASSSMNHVGSGAVAKLAVNDTLALKVLAGQINFDSNDNWSVVYLG